MIRPTAFRTLPAVAVTAAPALPLAQGAQAAVPTLVALATAAVGHPSQVRLVGTDFIRSHPRVEVRYGGPGPSERARGVPSAATLM
ncbi:hypothetical protein ABZ851_35530 [Streptomyces sp. NPDC047049]|uniref:hypothetical protein n=1 Tax=Streptomyces sp. NPDC047049 TaxID=3156688 RepID=UPI0034064B52